MIYVHTLGTASIDVGSCTINPTSPRKFALLLYLAAERGRAIPRATLQDLIFPDQAERNARHSLRELMYQLRQLGAELTGNPHGVELATEQARFDYEPLLSGQPISSDCIRAACGGFLPGFSPADSEGYADWYEAYRAQSIATLSRSLLGEVDQARNEGHWTKTERAARACLALDPLNEKATVALAEMLFLSGAKASAIQLLDRFENEVGRIHPNLKESVNLLRRRMQQAHEPIPARPGPRFVGRGEEMGALRSALRHARRGSPHCVVVYGEPGIGKSRLILEFRSIVELEGVRCESVAMHPHDANRPMGAFVDLVPSLLHLSGALGCSPQSMEALRRLTGVTIGATSGERDQTDLDAISFAVTDAILDVCESIAAEGPLCLVIEDAHSLDRYSVHVLSALISRRHAARILVVLNTREPRRLRGALRHVGQVTWIPLRPLSPGAMGELIDDIISPPPSSDARSRLVEAANGNPLFALSLINHYRHSLHSDAAPATLAELLSKRLDHASHVALGVLATCIALGKHCTTDRLLRAMEITPISLLEALGELAELGLVDAHAIHATPVHPLIAEVVRDRLLPAVRSVVYFRVANVFESDARNLGSPAYWWEAGNRWRDAGDPERALAAFRECARHALEIGRAADAARILNEALQLPASEQPMLEAAREMISAADLSSDTGLVLQGHAILKKAGLAERHDEFELAARRAVIRDSQLPERVFEMTLGCLGAKSATAEHRILAATIGLKGIHVAQTGNRVARMIEEMVSSADLAAVEDVIRLEFELILAAAKGDWIVAAVIADQLLRAAEGKRPSRQATIQQNCGIVLGLAGRPYAAVDAWRRAFSAAGLAQSPSQQVRLAALAAGVYHDLLDDENCDLWISRAVEASGGESGLSESFDLVLLQICRSFTDGSAGRARQLLARASEQGIFLGSPVRERWGSVLYLMTDVLTGPAQPQHDAVARSLVEARVTDLSGFRDFEIAAAAMILGSHNRELALKIIRTYLLTERCGKQLIDRQLVETIRRLELSDQVLESAMPPSPVATPT